MADSIDFILSSCPGIPDSMWIATASMIDAIIQKCWMLFGVFLAIKLISDASLDVANGKFELRPHVKTMFQAMLIAIFLAYYKPLLMFFDRFIDSLCLFDQEVLQASLARVQDRLPDYEQGNQAGKSWFLVIRTFVKMIFDYFPKVVALLTHGGALTLMHYIKAVALLVTSQFGPLAALFSLLPGPFKRGLATWAKSYINITCWTITISIFWVLTKTFSATSFWIESNSTATFLEENIGHTLLSIILFIAIFLTPTWTSKFIGSAITANVATGLNIAAGKLGMGGPRVATK